MLAGAATVRMIKTGVCPALRSSISQMDLLRLVAGLVILICVNFVLLIIRINKVNYDRLKK